MPLSLTPVRLARLAVRPDPAAGAVLRDRPAERLSAELAGGGAPRRDRRRRPARRAPGHRRRRRLSPRTGISIAQSSYGCATGFFANANHMADLLVCTLPFLAALLASARGGDKQRNSAVLVAGRRSRAAGPCRDRAQPLACGLSADGAGARAQRTDPALAAQPVAAAGACSPHPAARRRSRAVWTNAVRRPVRLATPLSRSRAGRRCLRPGARQFATSCRGARASARSAASIDLYEDPTQVTNTYVIHAHNDYAELALETGVPGILLMLAFLLVGAVDMARVAIPSGTLCARGLDRLGGDPDPQPGRFPAAHGGDQQPSSRCASRCSSSAAGPPVRRGPTFARPGTSCSLKTRPGLLHQLWAR